MIEFLMNLYIHRHSLLYFIEYFLWAHHNNIPGLKDPEGLHHRFMRSRGTKLKDLEIDEMAKNKSLTWL